MKISKEFRKKIYKRILLLGYKMAKLL